MKTPSVNQVVGYVAPPAKPGESTTIKKGVVLEALDGGKTARLDITERKKDVNGHDVAANEEESLGHHTAFATFDPHKKRENSFHFLDEAAAARSGRPAPTATPSA